jgi:glutamine synthetase adenylyltransferase
MTKYKIVAELSKQHSGLSIRTLTKRTSAIYLIPGLLSDDAHAQNYDLNLMTFIPLVVMIAWIRLMKWVIF